jgi:hypothetical protein
MNIQTMTLEERERLAYAEGFTNTAHLFARIADLQRALGEAVNEIEQLKTDLHAARYERAFLGGDA